MKSLATIIDRFTYTETEAINDRTFPNRRYLTRLALSAVAFIIIPLIVWFSIVFIDTLMEAGLDWGPNGIICSVTDLRGNIIDIARTINKEWEIEPVQRYNWEQKGVIMVKIACQTIVFGNTVIKDNMAEIAGIVKKTGYEGIETGARFFYQDKPDYYKDLFAKLDLKLLALHVGGDFLNKDSVKQQLISIKDTVIFGRKLDCPFIFLSGVFREEKTQENYLTEAESYKVIGKICNDEGLKLCYHNHDWELSNDGEGMKILLSEVPIELMKLVPDLGWIEVAGFSSLGFLKDNISRVEVLHFKDFNSKTMPREFTELGTGITPFKDVYDYVTGLGRDWWIVAEQDKTQLEPKEAVRINFEYISGLGK